MFALSSLMAASGNVSRAIQDLYQRFVTLNLLGTGTNNSTNNTFLDSSTNNFTVTRAGNTTQGSYSPFSTSAGYWSNYFNGTSYFSVPANAAFAFGTSNFTIEAWVYPEARASWSQIVGPHTAGVGANWALYLNTAGNLLLYISTGNNSSAVTFTSTSTVSLNQWSHVAVTRTSNTIRLFINGVDAGGSGSNTSNVGTNFAVGIGAANNGSGTLFTGYISNVRVVNGTSLYSSAFTPSTTPLTAVSGTSLLTCQSNRFVDNSSNAFAITRVGDSRVSPFGSFVPANTYNASTMGGSMYFDGTGDSLTVPANLAFDFGTGNYTVEFWFYKQSTANSNMFLMGSNPYFAVNASNTAYEIFLNGGSGTSINTTISLNTWNHFALVKSSNVVTVYHNGVSVGTINNSSTNGFSSQTVQISGPFTSFAGYISNLRVVKGTAVYTAAFTPPTAPVAAITGTSLLLNATNAGIFDSSAETVVETLGDAKISTTVSATGSIYFDGTGDYLTAPTSDLYAFGTGDFTVETWVRFGATSGFQLLAMLGNGIDASPAAYNAWSFYLGNGNLNFRRYAPESVEASRAWSPTTGQWYHVAVSRNGSNLRLFVDGTQLGATFTNSTNYAVVNTNPLTIGRFQAGGGVIYSTNAYLNNLRITKGFARYTANFTPTARS